MLLLVKMVKQRRMHFGILGLIASSYTGYIWLYSSNFIPQGHPRCHVVSHGVTSQDGSKTSKRSASQEFIPVATTRPETILGDSAVCVHPEVGNGWNWWESCHHNVETTRLPTFPNHTFSIFSTGKH
jgi:hypothetical protein